MPAQFSLVDFGSPVAFSGIAACLLGLACFPRLLLLCLVLGVLVDSLRLEMVAINREVVGLPRHPIERNVAVLDERAHHRQPRFSTPRVVYCEMQWGVTPRVLVAKGFLRSFLDQLEGDLGLEVLRDGRVDRIFFIQPRRANDPRKVRWIRAVIDYRPNEIQLLLGDGN